MKICIAGSRRFPEFGITKPEHWHDPKKRIIMCRILQESIGKSRFQIDEVVTGKCWGIDDLGEAWANKYKIPVKPFPADWDRFNKEAGKIRNKEMADYADALISIHSESSGSLDMIKCMKKLCKPIYIYKWK